MLRRRGRRAFGCAGTTAWPSATSTPARPSRIAPTTTASSGRAEHSYCTCYIHAHSCTMMLHYVCAASSTSQSVSSEPLMCSGVLDRSRSAQNRSRALDVFRCSGVLFGTGLRVAGVLACYDACACVRGRRVQQFSPRITTCLLSTITWLLLSQASRRRAVVVHDRQAGLLVFPGPLQGIRPRSGAPPENGGRPSGAHVAQCLVFDAWAGHAWDWVAAT